MLKSQPLLPGAVAVADRRQDPPRSGLRAWYVPCGLPGFWLAAPFQNTRSPPGVAVASGNVALKNPDAIVVVLPTVPFACTAVSEVRYLPVLPKTRNVYRSSVLLGRLRARQIGRHGYTEMSNEPAVSRAGKSDARCR